MPATVVAAPVVVVFGGVMLASAFCGIGGWLSGLGGIAMIVRTLGVMLVLRDVRRSSAARLKDRDDAAAFYLRDERYTVARTQSRKATRTWFPTKGTFAAIDGLSEGLSVRQRNVCDVYLREESEPP